MPRNRTPAELKHDYICSMGSPLGEVYYSLWQDVAWLHVKWDEYVQLYGTNRERVDLLNSTARLFFKVVHDVLWSDILLGIARLVDPPKTGLKKNMTIRLLPEAVDKSISAKVVCLTNRAVEASQFCTDRRNRRIAHRDFAVVMRESSKPLEQTSRAKVSEALRSIAAVLNAVEDHYRESQTYFTAMPHPPDGAGQLLCILGDGLKMDQQRRERLRNGEYTPEDFEIRDL